VFAEKVFRETGISVVAVSAVVSVLCLPLYNVAEKWQQLERDIQKRLKPKVDKIKAVFKGDEQYMILSVYYRQNHYHPAYALRGTVGLLIQIPFFIAAYSYLSQLGALKDVRFLFINNLGAPDALFKIGAWPINLLPILMTIINIAAGAVYTKGFPVKDKIQLYGMAVVFLVLLYKSPAGLVLYWTCNNIFSLVKNCYHAVKLRYKNITLNIFISTLLVLLAFYVLFFHNGSLKLRIITAVLLGLTSSSIWIWRVIRKYVLNREYIVLPEKAAARIFLVSGLSVWALFGLVTPSLLISASPADFSFIDTYRTPLFFLFNTALQAAGFFIFWPFCLYVLFSAKTKKTLSLILMALAVVSTVNVFLFPGNYGLISVALEFTGSVEHSIRNIIINLLVLISFTLVFLFLLHKCLLKTVMYAFTVCFSALVALSFVNISKIEQSYKKIALYYKPEDKTLKDVSPLFKLSKTGKNLVVIMLDRAVSVFIPYIFEESPELNSKYEGFIYYPNTVSFNGYTRIGAPPIFGGYDATPEAMNGRPDVPVKQKHNEALLMMPALLSRAGYFITATDSPYANYTEPPDMSIYDGIMSTKAYITDSAYTDVWLQEHDLKWPSVSDTLKRNIFWYSMLRSAPYFLREGIYLKGIWCSTTESSRLVKTLNGYAVLDYLPRLTDFNAQTENTALFFANNTTHEGSFLQAPDYRPLTFVSDYGSGPFRHSAAYHVNAAAVKRLSDWFDYLRENNAYNNTRIIIVSDHGPESNIVIKDDLPLEIEQFNPLLMVKDFDAGGPIRTDNTFMSNADVPTLALRGLINNPINPYTGNPINMDAKQKPLYINVSGSIFLQNTIRLDPKKDFYVRDNIFDPNNWERTEK
jgi:YidC/Oxa1 family membrane protein insertase